MGDVAAPVHPFIGFDVAALLELQAEAQGSKPFVHWAPFDKRQTSTTYSEFLLLVRRAAAGFARRGVKKHDKVLIHLENCPELLISWFACAWIGATAVLTNARAARDELNYFAGHSGVMAAITQPKFLDAVSSCKGLNWIAVTATDGGEAPLEAPPKSLDFSALLAEETLLERRPPEPMLPLGIQYTSGTTSRPKAVVFSHANALWGGKVGVAHTGLTQADVFLVHLPLYHVIALSYGMLTTLWAGASLVLMPRFSASRFWSTSVAFRCTWAAMVPFCVKALRDIPVPETHSYRAWGNAFWSAKLEQQFRTSIFGWWGMTELITHGIVGDYGKPGREMAIGRPAPEYLHEIRTEGGIPAAPGEAGMLFVKGVRGVSVFAEYLHDKTATDEAFDDRGFFKTGDIVTLHRDGFIEFSDRAKDMLKVGGENVAASEIERVIQSVPGVAEVAVVAKRDHMYGEIPVAFVVGKGDGDLESAIRAACEDKLAVFKRPREIRIIRELPRGLTDKVSKVALRNMAAS